MIAPATRAGPADGSPANQPRQPTGPSQGLGWQLPVLTTANSNKSDGALNLEKLGTVPGHRSETIQILPDSRQRSNPSMLWAVAEIITGPFGFGHAIQE